MKKFMEPAIELEIFAVEDVITASSNDDPVLCELDGYECTNNQTAWG